MQREIAPIERDHASYWGFSSGMASPSYTATRAVQQTALAMRSRPESGLPRTGCRPEHSIKTNMPHPEEEHPFWCADLPCDVQMAIVGEVRGAGDGTAAGSIPEGRSDISLKLLTSSMVSFGISPCALFCVWHLTRPLPARASLQQNYSSTHARYWL